LSLLFIFEKYERSMLLGQIGSILYYRICQNSALIVKQGYSFIMDLSSKKFLTTDICYYMEASLMMKFLCTIFIVLSFISSGYASEISIIELSDGSQITGEVVSFDGSTWIIQSESMGRLKIDSSKVRSIRAQDTTGQKQPGTASSGYQVGKDDIQAMQQSIMANQEILKMIMNLHDDPEIQSILKDPEIMNAVNAGDVNALIANPKFMRLLEKAEIKAITGEVAK